MPDYLTPLDVPAEVFVETGYGFGHTFRQALARPFALCISVECDPGIYARALAEHRDNPRAHLVLGDSGAVLGSVLDPARSTVFWLDAHYSRGGFGEGRPARECPLLDELRAIVAVPWATPPTIFIDDLNCFDQLWYKTPDAAGFRAEDWPTVTMIREALPAYTVTEHPTPVISGPGGFLRAVPA